MEADFMREYRIDLVAELPRITLRRFLVLVRGLGPASAAASWQAARLDAGGQAVRLARSPAESEAVLAGFFGRPAGRVN